MSRRRIATSRRGNPAIVGSAGERRANVVRPRMMGSGRILLLVACAGLFIASCSSAVNVSCTAIGAVSGVSFDLSRVTPREGLALVHACVRSKCEDQTVALTQNDRITVVDDTLDGPGPVAVTLVIRTQQRKMIFTASGQVVLKKAQPNGPKCPPTAWYRSVLATPPGDLTPA